MPVTIDSEDIDTSCGRPLPIPTSARPGTRAKVEVLVERWNARQQLWHPDDAALEDEQQFRVEVIEGQAKVTGHLYIDERLYRELQAALGADQKA